MIIINLIIARGPLISRNLMIKILRINLSTVIMNENNIFKRVAADKKFLVSVRGILKSPITSLQF